MGTVRPPAVAQFLLSLLLSPRYREQQLGDLREEYAARLHRAGGFAAWRWYWRQSLRSIVPNLVIRWRGAPKPPVTSRGSHSMETLFQDLRYGVRSLARSRAFAVIATLTLALAIGVNTAIFSLVNVIVFADLPMENPATVTTFLGENQRLGVTEGPLSIMEFEAFRDESRSFEGIAAWREAQWVLTGGDEPVRVNGYRVSANFERLWQIGIVEGRGFLPGEDQPGAPSVVILSHGFWTRHYGARREVIGSTIRLDGLEHTVVGILSPAMEFANLAEVEVWMPLNEATENGARTARGLFVTGRLLPDVPLEQARQDIGAISARLAEAYPASNEGWAHDIFLMEDTLLDGDGQTIITLLVMTVSFVLLIACANVANMLLARGTARAREMAVRTALGARRIRLVRQLLTEAVLIAVAASALGLVMSRVLMRVLIRITGGLEEAFTMATVDGNVLIFTVIVSVVAPLAFGLFPALRTASTGVSGALREGDGRSGAGRTASRTRNLLVSGQVSLALMLMVVAGLLAQAVINMQRAALGFEPTGVLSMWIALPDTKYDEPAKVVQFFDQLHDQLRAVPSVTHVALASDRASVSPGPVRAFAIEDRPALDDEAAYTAREFVVSPGYTDVLQIPVLRGRTFTTDDTESSAPVVMIGRETAERYWPDEDALGKRIRLDRGDQPEDWAEIVGIVGNVRSGDEVEEQRAQLYVPHTQRDRTTMLLLVRSTGSLETLATPVRAAVWALDPDQPIDDVRTMERALYDDQSTAFALITLFVTFAVFALAMAAIGIYGVMSYAVSQRTAEISIRMALGAEAPSVRAMVLWQGTRLIAYGTVVGLVGAFLISQMLAGLLYNISTLDPLTFVGVPAVLVACGLVANYLPALRATRIDPMEALRS
jgi:predicted permease